MSRRRRRPQNTRVIEQERPQEQRRVPNIKPGATNFKPLSNSLISAMYQNMGPQANQDTMYSPGAPLRPVPGLVPPQGPRGFDYPVGYNIGQLPRSTEQYSFADLRALAAMYDGIQMCQQVWFDYINKLELVIEPRPDLIGEEQDTSMYQDDIQTYLDFFAFPDKDHDLHEWLCMAVRDQLEIDALAIYVRPNKIGRPYSLDIIDGAMIKPLVDDRGRRPQLPFPAYEQFVHGIPAALLTADDLIYVKETERSDSVYGRSRVERIILKVNQALRKQTKDLARFTDGTVPQGLIEPSMDVQWSQEEIEAYEIQFNNLMAGNDEMRARVKVLPRGFIYKSTDDPDIHVDLDQFILNITAACHGLTMAELAFTQDVNRASGDSQENVVYRRAMGPLMARYGKLFTNILKKYFKENRFVCKFVGYQETEDFNAQASGYSTLTNAGILGLTDAARLLKLPQNPDAPYIGRVFFSKDGPIFLDDMASDKMRNAAVAAKLAGFDLASNPQTQTPQESDTEPVEDTENANEEGQEEENNPAVSRLIAQVEELLVRLNQTEPGDEDEVERTITALLQTDETEPLTTLERDWTAWNKTHPYQKHPKQKKEKQPSEDKKDAESDKKDEKQEEKQDATEHTAKSASAKAHAKVAQHQAHAHQAVHQAVQKTAHSTTHAQKQQAKAAHTAARAQAKATKALTSLTKSMSTKASVYEAMANRKISKTWTAQDAADAKAIASDLTKLMNMVGSHEGDAEAVVKDMQSAIQGLLNQAPKAMSGARIAALSKLASMVEQQMSRSQVPDFDDLLLLDGENYAEEDTEQVMAAQEDQNGEAAPSISAHSEKAVADEYRRWRGRAIEDVKTGKTQRGFTTTIIPEAAHRWISDELTRCKTPDDVRSVFNRAREEGQEPMIGSRDDLAKQVHAVFSKVAQRGHDEIATMGE